MADDPPAPAPGAQVEEPTDDADQPLPAALDDSAHHNAAADLGLNAWAPRTAFRKQLTPPVG